MKIRNINEKYGDPIVFACENEMEEAVKASGYEVPEEGLVEGRDYEYVHEFRVVLSNDNDHFPEWLPIFDLFADRRFATKREADDLANRMNETAWAAHLEKIHPLCREYYRCDNEEFAPMFTSEIC
jgi:hypothetical protein